MTDQTLSGDLPSFIYGTAWKEDETKQLTKTALKAGFRAIDTANQRKHYYEDAVGDAVQESIEEGLVDRDDLFLQTKFTYAAGQDHRMPYDPEDPLDQQVRDSFESSLNHLGIEALDSYVLHGPAARTGLNENDRTVWRAMEELASSGRVEHLGVSNVSAEQLEDFVDLTDTEISFVQNRCFARSGWDRRTRNVCETHDITYQGFSLLTANQRELQSQTVREVAERHDRTIPQIIFRFAVEIGMIPLTGTTDSEHMQQDLECLDFELPDEDVEAIETI